MGASKSFGAVVIIQKNGVVRHLDGKYLGHLSRKGDALTGGEEHEKELQEERTEALRTQGITL